MQIEKMITNHFGVNTWIISDETIRQAAVIDPGGIPDRIVESLHKKQLDLTMILLTHAHADHIAGAAGLQRLTGRPVFIHETGNEQLEIALKMAPMLGFPDLELPERIEFFTENFTQLSIGKNNIRILHLPGHSPCSSAFMTGCHLFSGDTLFENSIGRVDLPGGSRDKIAHSIRKLCQLPETTIVYPGHGSQTTIGKEKHSNPWIREFTEME